MRTCKQCDSEMVNGFDIKVDGASYGIKITKNIIPPIFILLLFIFYIVGFAKVA